MVAQLVKTPPAMRETPIRPLGREDPRGRRGRGKRGGGGTAGRAFTGNPLPLTSGALCPPPQVPLCPPPQVPSAPLTSGPSPAPTSGPSGHHVVGARSRGKSSKLHFPTPPSREVPRGSGGEQSAPGQDCPGGPDAGRRTARPGLTSQPPVAAEGARGA